MTEAGTARERTRLAWDRTALSAAGLAVLLVKLGWTHSRPLDVVAAAAVGVSALVLAIRPSHATHRRLLVVGVLVTVASSIILLQIAFDLVDSP